MKYLKPSLKSALVICLMLLFNTVVQAQGWVANPSSFYQFEYNGNVKAYIQQNGNIYAGGGIISDGDIWVMGSGELDFGSTTRQMINLYGQNYGLDDKGHLYLARGNAVFKHNLVVGDTDDRDMDNTPYSDYKLWVQGGIVGTDFAIAEVTEWEDRVFDEDYSLTSLKDVESHIINKKHLHTMPSEQELIDDGYELHDMNKRMVRTIEELTLHTINQKKKIEQIMSRLEALENK